MIRCAHTTGLVLVVLAASATRPAAGQKNSFMSAEQAGSKAVVSIIDGEARLRVDTPTGGRTLALGKGWERVTNVRFSQNSSLLAIVADTPAPALSIVDVAGAPARVLATYPVETAAVSPDGRAVAFEYARRQPLNKGVVALVPLNAFASEAATSDVRTENAGAVRLSPFTWTDPEVVVFVDRVGTDMRLVALQVDVAGRVQRRGHKTLPLQDIMDASKATADGAAQLIEQAEISRVPSAGLTLALRLPASPALKTRSLELSIW